LSTEIPAQVRPLYQLWRDGQALQLQLAEERQRYSKLQQSSDSELDTLRQQHHVLQQQLELTTRKLENLTDIERQLSTRKPAGNFSPDTPHESEKPAPSTDEVTPDEP
ncbi:two-component system QseEF-associated lipoprotein QseG, partial [Escherichia coli]|nr:two-component system QseEF-associated lipoprotein QseG [Escherichia coli]